MATVHTAQNLYLVNQMVAFKEELSTIMRQHWSMHNYVPYQITTIWGITLNRNGLELAKNLYYAS